MGKRNGDARNHKAKPYENQIIPTDDGNGIGKEFGGDRGGGIAGAVQKTRGAGDHSGIPETGTVTAPKHGGSAVGGESREDKEHDVQHWMTDEIYQCEEAGSRGKSHKDGQIHVPVEALIQENGDEGCERNAECDTGEHQRGFFRRKTEMLGNVSRKPKDHCRSHDAGDDGNQSEFNDSVLNQHFDRAAFLAVFLIFSVFDQPDSFKP